MCQGAYGGDVSVLVCKLGTAHHRLASAGGSQVDDEQLYAAVVVHYRTCWQG
jgi:hypothetical protein